MPKNFKFVAKSFCQKHQLEYSNENTVTRVEKNLPSSLLAKMKLPCYNLFFKFWAVRSCTISVTRSPTYFYVTSHFDVLIIDLRENVLFSYLTFLQSVCSVCLHHYTSLLFLQRSLLSNVLRRMCNLDNINLKREVL